MWLRNEIPGAPRCSENLDRCSRLRHGAEARVGREERRPERLRQRKVGSVGGRSVVAQLPDLLEQHIVGIAIQFQVA